MRWVKEYVDQSPEAPQPKKVKTEEMDELFTFIGKKKKQNLPDHHGVLANTLYFRWKAAWERSAETIQYMWMKAPKAQEYFRRILWKQTMPNCDTI